MLWNLSSICRAGARHLYANISWRVLHACTLLQRNELQALRIQPLNKLWQEQSYHQNNILLRLLLLLAKARYLFYPPPLILSLLTTFWKPTSRLSPTLFRRALEKHKMPLRHCSESGSAQAATNSCLQYSKYQHSYRTKALWHGMMIPGSLSSLPQTVLSNLSVSLFWNSHLRYYQYASSRRGVFTPFMYNKITLVALKFS